MEKKAFVLWFTGLSGAGKTTIGRKIFEYLKNINIEVEYLDGDIIRNIFPSTGFDRDSRNEHIKRVGYLASILEKHGISVVAAFISPYRESRNFVREICKNFIEVYVSTPIKICEERDVKGLYKKARQGLIKNFTGISDPYEPPVNPELIIDTTNLTIQESCDIIIDYLKKHNFIAKK